MNAYSIGDVLTLLGSLGLFLYGMKVMSDALLKVAGDRMRNFLATMTSNRFKGVLTGFIITAIIQSSSATTLMVVSFVNASLLTLVESIGVIMGANIGTTVTAWLITILGFKVKMSAIALPLVALGFLLTFIKKERVQDWGIFIIGFSILFIALELLKDSVPDLQANPEILRFLSSYTELGYSSLFLFLLIGTLLTVILQSSSATMALTLIMCNEGWIPFEMAAAMVLGENVGTTITANLASLVANVNAKRTARAHFIFNMLGVVWMLVLFYPFLHGIDYVLTQNGNPSPFIQATAIPVALSVYHTSFNIINTFILIWFVPLIARLVTWMVRDKVEKKVDTAEPVFLSEDALKYPQTAIKALVNESKRLYKDSVYEVVSHGLNVHRKDLESDRKLKKIVKESREIGIDVDDIYYHKIKTIYGKIMGYATQIQSRFKLDMKKIIHIRNITLANRYMVEVVKNVKSIQVNLHQYGRSENEYISNEYRKLQTLILTVVREMNEIQLVKYPDKKLNKLEKLRARARKSDVLLSGKVEKLVKGDHISDDMAISLINDSHSAILICDRLVSITELLYIHHDNIVEELPEIGQDVLDSFIPDQTS